MPRQARPVEQIINMNKCLIAPEKWLAAVGKLTEIVEVENETWQEAKFGVC